MFGLALAWKNGKREKRIITYRQTRKHKQSQMHDNMNSTKYSISIESINSKKKISQRSLLKVCQQSLELL
jgi:hypothetical protein